jgi:hypothetical protein
MNNSLYDIIESGFVDVAHLRLRFDGMLFLELDGFTFNVSRGVYIRDFEDDISSYNRYIVGQTDVERGEVEPFRDSVLCDFRYERLNNTLEINPMLGNRRLTNFFIIGDCGSYKVYGDNSKK